MNLDSFWAGTEESLRAFLAQADVLTPDFLAECEKRAAAGALGERQSPRLLSKQGQVGVIAIDGSLVNNSSWMNQYLGATGYPEIREALIAAANDPDIKAIVLDVNSGGGSTMGMSDTGELIALVDSKVKPVHAFSGSSMNSAAYWLSASARSVTLGKMAEAGSIGVLVIHREQSQRMEKEGITTTVMRAGKYKALANPYEPLSEDAKAEVQGQLDQLYGMFAQHVADSRGVPYTQADQKMGQGRVFMGQLAVDIGLADRISSFDELLSKLQGGIDAEKKSPKYGANSPKGPSSMKHALTEQAIAALAAGGVLPEAGDPTEIAAAAALAAAALAVVPVADAAPAAPVAEAAPVAPVAETVDARIQMLKEQLAEATASTINVSVQLAALKQAGEGATAAMAALNTTLEQMRPIVQGVVKNMHVALGGSAFVASTTDEALLAEFTSVQANFAKKFKAGGVAASSSAAADNGGAKESVDGFRRARIDATRPK
jgi:signal peptide peptidase SppA